MYKQLAIVGLTSFMFACSESNDAEKVQQDHVWKEQTEMINKAKAIEQLLSDTAKQQQQQLIDNQTQ